MAPISFDTDTLGSAKKYEAVTHQIAVPIAAGSPKSRRAPHATFGFDFGRQGGGSQRALLIDLGTRQEINTIYRTYMLAKTKCKLCILSPLTQFLHDFYMIRCS